MKTLEQIKKELHKYIDGISDKKELTVIYENALNHLESASRIAETNESNHLTNCQQEKIKETIHPESSDDKKRDKETRRSTARWFNDGGQNAC